MTSEEPVPPIKDAVTSGTFGITFGASRKAGAFEEGQLTSKNEIRDRFLARLKCGIPLRYYQHNGKRKDVFYVELFSMNDCITLQLHYLSKEKYIEMVGDIDDQMQSDMVMLADVAMERNIERGRKKKKKNIAEAAIRKTTGFKKLELCTVDISELKKITVDHGHSGPEDRIVLDFMQAGGGTFHLELCGSREMETTFLYQGFDLNLEDWTQNTGEYSDFWDSL